MTAFLRRTAAYIPVTLDNLVSLPVPTMKFTGKTIIVTGSNTGIGLEAARYFVRLDAAKVILAVRTHSKGLSAKASIDASEGCDPSVVEVWDLDLESYDSVKACAAKALQLERLDILVSNAGIWNMKFSMVEQDESHVTVNLVNLLLFSLMVLPKMRETSVKFNTVVVNSITGSFVHTLTQFPERKNENIMESLNVEKAANMGDRYNIVKLILLFAARALAEDLDHSSKGGNIVVNTINPGAVRTNIFDQLGFFTRMQYASLSAIFRSSDVAARNLVCAAAGGKETNGKFMTNCKVVEPSKFVRSEEGLETQEKLWVELKAKLEKIQPGVTRNI